jgi:hypothetical protein
MLWIAIALFVFTGTTYYAVLYGSPTTKRSTTHPELQAASGTITPSSTELTSATQYLLISQWGVRLAEPADLELVYSATPDSSAVTLSSLELLRLDPVHCAASDAALGAIVRSASIPTHGGDAITDRLRPSEYAQVGPYYYYYQTPQATCSGLTDDNSAFQANALQTQEIGQLRDIDLQQSLQAVR